MSDYSDLILLDSPVAYWRLGEEPGATTAVDQIGSYDLTYTNSPMIGYRGLVDDSDNSVFFQGTTQYAGRTETNFRGSDTQGSIEAWFRTLHNDYGSIFQSADTGIDQQQLSLVLFPTGEIAVDIRINGSTVNTVRTQSQFADGKAHHVVVTSNASSFKIYVDGVLRDTTLMNGADNGTWFSSITSAEAIYIGVDNRGTPTSHFKGVIDEVAVYSSALSATKIAEHFAVGTRDLDLYEKAVIKKAPVDWWRLSDKLTFQSGIPIQIKGIEGYPGNIPGFDIWRHTKPDYTWSVKHENGKIALSNDIGANTGGTLYATSKDYFDSDFDIQLLLDSFSVTGGAFGADYGKVGLFILVQDDSTSLYALFVSDSTNNNFWTYDGVAFNAPARTNNFGGVRITRSGSTMTFYTKDGNGSWVSRSSRSVSSVRCRPRIICEGDDLSGISITTNITSLTHGATSFEVGRTTSDIYAKQMGLELIHEATPTTTTQSLVPYTKLYKNGVTYNGSTQYSYYNYSDYRGSDSAGTIEAWIKMTSPPSPGSYYMIFASSDTASNSYHFYLAIGPNSELRVGVRENLTDLVVLDTPNSTIKTNVTHHVVVTSNGSTNKIFVNGIEQSLNVTLGTNSGQWFSSVTNRDNISIAAWVKATVTIHFPGTISDVAVYDYALSAADILENYEAGITENFIYPETVVFPKQFLTYNNFKYKNIILKDNPIAYWRLGEKVGTTAFDEMNNYNLTYVATPTLGVKSLLSDLSDTAVTFTRVNSEYAEAETNYTGIVRGLAQISFETWLNINDPTGNSYLWYTSQATSGFTNFAIRVEADGSIDLAWRTVNQGTSYNATTNAGIFTYNKTHHLVAVLDTTNNIQSIYLDGTLVGSGTVATGVITDEEPIRERLGCGGNAFENYVDGTLDEVAIYDYALNSRQIMKHYEVGANKSLDLNLLYKSYKTQTIFPLSNEDSYAKMILNDNPVAYWRLGESTGTTAVDERRRYNLTYTGSPTLEAEGLILADPNKAVTFNGTTQYATRTESGFRSSDNQGTVELWLKADLTAVSYWFNTNDNTGTSYFYAIGVDTAGSIFILARENGTNILAVGTANKVSNNKIHHIVITSDASLIKMYIDGKESPTTTTQGTNTGQWFSSVTNRDNVNIAALVRNTVTDYLNGTMDEVAVYNYPLLPKQIATHYKKGKNIFQFTDSFLMLPTEIDHKPTELHAVVYEADKIAPNAEQILTGRNGWDKPAFEKYIHTVGPPEFAYREIDLTTIDLTSNAYRASFCWSDRIGKSNIQETPVIGSEYYAEVRSDSPVAYWRLAESTAPVFINGTFQENINNWTTIGGSITHNSTGRRISVSRSNAGFDVHGTYATVTGFTIGKAYTITVDVVTATHWTNVSVYHTAGTWNANKVVNATFTTNGETGTLTLNFVATATTNYLRLYVSNSTTAVSTFDNIAVTESLVKDEIGSYDLFQHNTPTLGATSLLSTDTANKAMTFASASNEYLTRNETNFRSGDSSGSFECWFSTSHTSTQYIFTVGDVGSTGNGYYLSVLMLSTGEIRIQHDSDGLGANLLETNDTYNDGNTHHLVITSNGTAWTIYIDGVPVLATATGSNNGDWFADLTASDNISIGMQDTASGGPTGFFNGTLDEVAIYSSELTPQQIAKHYTKGAYSSIRLQPTYYEEVLLTNPISYWRMGEPSGSTMVDEVGGHDMTYQNTPTLGVAGLIDNDTDTAVTFASATSEYASLAHNAAFSTTEWTVTGWVKVNTLPSADWTCLLMKSTTGIDYDGWGCRISNSGQMAMTVHQSAVDQTVVSATNTIKAGITYHLAYVVSTSGLFLYVNGILVKANTSYSGNADTNTGAMKLADSGAGADKYLDGTVDEVTFYGTALTQTEILKQFRRGKY